MMLPLTCNASYATTEQLTQLMTLHGGRGMERVIHPAFKLKSFKDDEDVPKSRYLERLRRGIHEAGLQKKVGNGQWTKVPGTRDELVNMAMKFPEMSSTNLRSMSLTCYDHGETRRLVGVTSKPGTRLLRMCKVYENEKSEEPIFYAHLWDEFAWFTMKADEFEAIRNKSKITKELMEKVLFSYAIKEYKRQSKRSEVPDEHIVQIRERIPELVNALCVDGVDLHLGKGQCTTFMHFIDVELKRIDWRKKIIDDKDFPNWKGGSEAKELWSKDYVLREYHERGAMMRYGHEINGSLYIVASSYELLRVTPRFGFDFIVRMHREKMLRLVDDYRNQPMIRLTVEENKIQSAQKEKLAEANAEEQVPGVRTRSPARSTATLVEPEEQKMPEDKDIKITKLETQSRQDKREIDELRQQNENMNQKMAEMQAAADKQMAEMKALKAQMAQMMQMFMKNQGN